MDPLLEPFVSWLSSFSALTFVLTLLAIVTLTTLLWRTAKKALPGVKATISFLEALAQLPTFMVAIETRLPKIESALHEVRHEVLPNRGGSMRDDLTMVGLRVKKIEALHKDDTEEYEVIDQELQSRQARRDAHYGSQNPELD